VRVEEKAQSSILRTDFVHEVAYGVVVFIVMLLGFGVLITTGR